MRNGHPLLRPNHKAKAERAVEWIARGMAWITIWTAAMILLCALYKGLSTFFINNGSMIDFFTGDIWDPGSKDGRGKPMIGALPFMAGSLAVTVLSAFIAAPIAIGAAILIVEISPHFGRKILQPVVELLMGIPSVIYGFFGLSVIVPTIRNHSEGIGFGIGAAAVVLALMMLPTVTVLAASALKRVPPEFREASFALGATRWQTICRLVLKGARPGLWTAVIFGMMRAFGEALAVQMVIGNAAVIPVSLFEPAATLTSILTVQFGSTVMGQTENNALWSLALILMAMSGIFMFIMQLAGKRRAAS